MRPSLSASDFDAFSTSQAVAELHALGVPLDRPDDALHVLFPKGAEHLRVYKFNDPPSLDIPHMELDDSLCHIRFIVNCIHRFNMRRKKISRDLFLLHRRHRAGQSPQNTKTTDSLFQRLYHTTTLQ